MRYADPYAVAGQWYKGNLHTHTTQSDGRLAPEQVVAWYDQNGYDFVAITDHDTFLDPTPLQGATRMTLIPGFEFSRGVIAEAHMLCLGVRQVWRFLSGGIELHPRTGRHGYSLSSQLGEGRPLVT